MPNAIPQGYNVFFDILQQIQDEGIDLPFQNTLNFIGDGVTAVDDPGNNRTNVNIPLNVLPHDWLSSTHPDTVPASPVRGDIVIGNATPAWERLPKGTAGFFLKVNANDVLWDQIDRTDIVDFNHQLLDSSVHTDTVTQGPTVGSIVFGNATPLWDELVIGTPGQVLTVVGGIPAWADATGGAGVWEDLADVTLAVDASVITATFSPRTFLRIYVILHVVDSASGVDTDMIINGDTGTNYAIRRSINGGADSTGTNQSQICMEPGTINHQEFFIIDIVDQVDHQKIGMSKTVSTEADDEFTAPERQINHFTYSVPGARVTSVTFTNTNAAGDYRLGVSKIRVLGYD